MSTTSTQHTTQAPKHSPRSAGSVYLVTLITVAAIASMVLVGVKLRSSTNTQSTLVTEMSKNTNSTHSAAEYLLESIANNDQWSTKAESGIAFNDFTIDDINYSATVTDAETDTKPDSDTTNYHVKVVSDANNARAAAQIEIKLAKNDYVQLLNDLHATFYWPLNDPEKSTEAEELLHSHNGTYNALTTASSGTNDEGAPVATFNASSDHIEVEWDNKLKQKEGTITMWIKYTGPSNSSTIRPFAGIKYQSGGNPTLNLAVIYNTLAVYIDDSGNYDFGHMLFSDAGDITPNQWMHIAMTWSNSSGLSIYIDGDKVGSNGSNTEGVNTALSYAGGNQPLLIGAGYHMYNSGTPLAGFVGEVAHVVFFDPLLSADEVANLASIKPDEIIFSVVEDSWQVLVNE